MSVFQGSPLPNITTDKTVTTQGPDWYNQYLTSLAAPGTAMVGKTGAELTAPMSSLQTGALAAAPDALTRYQDLMSSASEDAQTAAQGVTPEMVQSFMNPYTTGVVDEMSRLSQQNMQRNLMPSLKAAFTGTGGMGSQRMMSALGQMGTDVARNLTGQQTAALQKGYSDAVSSALAQAGLLQKGAQLESGVASADLQAALDEIAGAYGLGSKEQAFRQSQITAPLTTAKAAADVFANLKVPSTVGEKYTGPIPGAYSTSPLAQIAGLGSLFASGAGGTSAAQGLIKSLGGLPNIIKYLTGDSEPELLGGGDGTPTIPPTEEWGDTPVDNTPVDDSPIDTYTGTGEGGDN
jgi:hypothetical protein